MTKNKPGIEMSDSKGKRVRIPPEITPACPLSFLGIINRLPFLLHHPHQNPTPSRASMHLHARAQIRVALHGTAHGFEEVQAFSSAVRVAYRLAAFLVHSVPPETDRCPLVAPPGSAPLVPPVVVPSPSAPPPHSPPLLTKQTRHTPEPCPINIRLNTPTLC
jgi:hypothetical protein